MTDSLLAPGREVLYKRCHTGEPVRATVLGPSAQGDDLVRLKYIRNGRVLNHNNTPSFCGRGTVKSRPFRLSVCTACALRAHCVHSAHAEARILTQEYHSSVQ